MILKVHGPTSSYPMVDPGGRSGMGARAPPALSNSYHYNFGEHLICTNKSYCKPSSFVVSPSPLEILDLPLFSCWKTVPPLFSVVNLAKNIQPLPFYWYLLASAFHMKLFSLTSPAKPLLFCCNETIHFGVTTFTAHT